MNIFQAVVLGIVQGLTEFLPVSSSGHLVLFSKIPGWQQQPLVFDTTLHLATAATLLLYFRHDLLLLVRSFVSDFLTKFYCTGGYAKESKLLLFMVVGSVPAGVLGFLFESDFENKFRSVASVAFFLIAGSLLILLAQKVNQKCKFSSEPGLVKSIIIGLFQSLALFPGVSRSGATISGAMILGFDKVYAARFSFLLSIPIVVLAGGYKLITTDFSNLGLSWAVLSTGFLSSFITGLFVVRFLLNFLKKHSLNVFIYYRLILATIHLIVAMI